MEGGYLNVIPGEYQLREEDIECNAGRETMVLRVANTGDRPIQVGSHFHFAEVNKQLSFDRQAAIGYRLNIPSGTAVRFEPGEEQEVELVELGGLQQIFGLNSLTNGSLSKKEEIVKRIKQGGFKGGQTEA